MANKENRDLEATLESASMYLAALVNLEKKEIKEN